MPNFEDLTHIKVNEAIQTGLKAQRNQRGLHAKTDANSQLSLFKPLKWLALLVWIIKGI